MFELRLLPASAPGHDAIAANGRTKVQIKLTQGKTIALRSEPEHLIVLRLTKDLAVEVVYNGRGASVWQKTGKLRSNGTRMISISKLRRIDKDVVGIDRLTQINQGK